MKNIYSILLLIIVFPAFSFGWGSDINISTAPIGKHSAVSKNDGTIFVSVPDSVSPSNYSISFYQSSDTGATWLLMSSLTTTYPSSVVKTKMLITGMDSMYCIFQTGDSIYTYNFQDNSIKKFAVSFLVTDFDAVASTHTNALFLFPVNNTTSQLRRWSSLSGGATWNNIGPVSSFYGNHPVAAVNDSTVVVCYNDKLSSTVPNTEIEFEIYTEISPGGLTRIDGGGFGDGTGLTFMSQYCVAVEKNYIWLVFTFSPSSKPQVLYSVLSTDKGANWGSFFAIDSVAGTNKFIKYLGGAGYFQSNTNFGFDVTYYLEDSLASASPTNNQMFFVTVNDSAPTVFSSPVAFNQFTTTSSSYNPLPILVEFNNSSVERGVVWMEDNGTGSGLWYDRSNSTWGVGTIEHELNRELKIYPNPTESRFTIVFPTFVKQVDITNALGQNVKSLSVPMYTSSNNLKFEVDVSNLAPGTYLVSAIGEERIFSKHLVISPH